jgi:peptide/nickel transport system substrate-binding protein
VGAWRELAVRCRRLAPLHAVFEPREDIMQQPIRARRTILAGLVACAVATAAAQTITIASPGSTGAFIDPQRNNAIAAMAVSEMLADTLLLYRDGEYIPALATSWTFDASTITYTFDLREGVTFHNGVPFDAEAVVFSIERIRNPDDPMPAAGMLAGVTEVRATGPLTVTITLDAIDPDFLLKLYSTWIVEPGSAADGAVPVGTGPFTVSEYEPDQRIVLSRYDDYWAGAAAFEQVIVRNIPDPGTLVLELEAGTVDLILFTPPREVVRLDGLGYNAMTFGAVNAAYVALNNDHLDPALRRAICWAIDRDVLLETAYAGLGDPMLTVAKAGSWAHDPTVTGYGYDPERAKEVLDAAGYVDTTGDGYREHDGQRLDLDLQSRGDGEWLLSSQIIQQFLDDVGIRSTITTSERTTYYDAVRTGRYDLGWFITNALPEPPILNHVFHSSEYWNVTQAPRADLDALIDAGRSTADEGERIAAYFEFQSIVFEDAVQCPVLWVLQAHVASPRLEGVSINAQGILHDVHTWALGD